MRSLPVNVQGSTDLSRMIMTKMMKAESRGSRQVRGLRCQCHIAAIQSGVRELQRQSRNADGVFTGQRRQSAQRVLPTSREAKGWGGHYFQGQMSRH